MQKDPNPRTPGVWLESLTWKQAENRLNPDCTVVIPLGGAAKEHGPHLPLGNDALIANWLAGEVTKRLPVVIAPIINASYYPAFVDYPGSISLRLETARDLVIDCCTSLAAFGVQHFYVLNTGLSTERVLRMAAEQLAAGSIYLEYLVLSRAYAGLDPTLLEQEYGSHADERETSLMLHIAPGAVDLTRAVDDGSEGNGKLVRTPGLGVFSPSGVYGRPTLASANKGRQIARALVECAVREISQMME